MNYLFLKVPNSMYAVIGILTGEMRTHPAARLLFLLLFVSTRSVGQDIRIPHDFIYRILDDSGLISDIVVPIQGYRPIDITDIPFAKGKTGPMQKLVRTSHGLFVLVDGTGRVYEIFRNELKLQVRRTDSTVFFGNNFGAFHFAYNDTIYSFGGYGFWHYNGQLRVYLPDKHEWELVELNREIPIQVANPISARTWFDYQSGQLYVIRMPSKALESDSIYVLSLNSKAWKTLGLSTLPLNLSEFIQTPFGPLARASDSNRDIIYLLDFRKNRILEMSPAKAQEIRLYEGSNSLAFSADSTLILFRDNAHSIDIGIQDFNLTAQTIYDGNPEVTMPGLNWMKAFYILTGFVLTLLLGIFLGRRRAKANKEPSRENHSMSTPANLFDEREKELIRLIFENSSKSISTSIDDINLVLGLAGRPVDV